jgi:uncharacterized protein (DUF302 family)
MSDDKTTGKTTNISFFIGGLILGIALTGFIIAFSMPRMMLNVHESRLGFDETVAAIENSAMEQGWKVPKIYDIQKSLVDAGHTEMGRLTILSLCQPDHAYEILKEDSRKKVSAIMPCRLAVYEAKGGKVYVAGLNVGLMSKMFGGMIEEVMGDVADEEKEMLKKILK